MNFTQTGKTEGPLTDLLNIITNRNFSQLAASIKSIGADIRNIIHITIFGNSIRNDHNAIACPLIICRSKGCVPHHCLIP